MKLPGISYGGVQSLGRFETSGPMRAANAAAAAAHAEARAAGATAQALQATGNVAMRYYEQNAAAEYDRAVAEAQMKEKELRTMLTSGPVLDTQRWQIPDWVSVPGGMTETITDATGRTQTVPRRFIPTYEVASQVYTGAMQRVQDAVTSEVRNPLARSQLKRKLPAMFADGQAVVTAKQHDFYIAHQKGLVGAAVEDFIQAGDEKSARTAVLRAFHTGLMDPSEYQKQMASIGSRVDSLSYVSDLHAAQTPDEVEAVQNSIRSGMVRRVDPETGQLVWGPSRLSPDKQWQMRGRAETLLNEADKKQNIEYKENMQGLLASAYRGELSAAAVPGLLTSNKVNHQQAITLMGVLKDGAAGATATSDAGAVDAFRRQIQSARHLSSGERQSAKMERVDSNLFAALNGVYPSGRAYTGPRLSGDDHKKLLAEMRREEKWVQGAPEYGQALGRVKAITKYSSDGFASGTVSAESFRAYSDFRTALDDYIDRYGADADPLQFVKDNAEMFTQERYAEVNLADFAEKYPNFGYSKADVEADPVTIRSRILGEISRQMRDGRVDEERARILIQQVTGEDMILGLDASVELEAEEEEGWRYVQEEELFGPKKGSPVETFTEELDWP
jgi:hypothetical protein